MPSVAKLRESAKRRLPDKLLQQLRPLQSRISGRLHSGDVVSCPVCGRSFARFLTYKDRNGALCPGCRTLERHRKLKLVLHRYTDLYSTPRKVLHIAPERFLQEELKSLNNIDYLSGDLMDPTAMVKLDVTEMQFADDTFDVIFCSHVLEHVPDDRKALRELIRVLKPGGWAILDVPVDMGRHDTYEDWSITEPSERTVAFGQDDHVRVYGRDYPELVRSVGFDLTVDPVPFSEEEKSRYGLSDNDHVFFARKLQG